jgi:hypothetical protein
MVCFGAIGGIDEPLEPERTGAPGRPDRGNPKQHGFALPLFQRKRGNAHRLYLPRCASIERASRKKRSAFRRVHNRENAGTNRLFGARD